MKFLVVSKNSSLAKEVKRAAVNRSVTIVEAKSPTQAVEYLNSRDDFELVIVSMASTWGGSGKWDRVVEACGKRQACIFVPDTCEIHAISGVILNNQVVCPLDTPAGKRVFSMMVNGLVERKQPAFAPRNAASSSNVRSPQYFDKSGHAIRSPRFTRRQKQVLDLMVAGKSNREIAHELNVAEGTVKLHSLSIYRSLGVSNRVQAVLRGQQLTGT